MRRLTDPKKESARSDVKDRSFKLERRRNWKMEMHVGMSPVEGGPFDLETF